LENLNPANLEKIESFINDSNYKEVLENSVNYNTRLCVERRMRLPFLDSQTRVAQNHSSLFMSKRQRMPGTIPGQIYTYPRQRWRKKRRQYLMMNARAFARAHDIDDELHSISQMENPALQDTDSKDSQMNSEMNKEWYYDEQDMLEIDPYDEPDQDSDLDYEESYSKRNKRKKGAGRGRGGALDSPGTPGRKKGPGRGRKKAIHSFDSPAASDADKPFACERTPGRRGRPAANHPPPSSPAPPPSSQVPPALAPNLSPDTLPPQNDDPPMPVLVPENRLDTPPVQPPPVQMPVQLHPHAAPIQPGSGPDQHKPKAPPSPYCDFCLGDSTENKKTGGSEELVSCSDCGRSGHPTCLQFTANMNVSVKKYRWQCIECKCCSVCGTSDNDDQLLFCDDCDRGYHMYCLSPPLTTPPEGSWSCALCIQEFHK